MGQPGNKQIISALLIGVAFITVTLSACAPTSPPPEPVSPAAEAPNEIQRVTLEESRAAFDNKAATFVDVRSASSYAAGHIPNALSIPLAELEPRVSELDPNQWIITYCT